MTQITESDVMMYWPVFCSTLHIEPIAIGANNQSYLVTSAAGSYILKCYQNLGVMESVRFEHRLLSRLATVALPFAVPSLLRTKFGETIVEIEHHEATYHAALFHRISGRAAEYGDESEAYQGGKSLALLDHALSSTALLGTVPVPEAYGELSSIHAYVPDPLKAIEQLPLDPALGTALASLVASIEDEWTNITSGWQSQLIHGDFYPTNVLVDLGKVSGILDFEFSGMGFRAMDFSIGMAAFSTRDWSHGWSWPLLESFAKGYLGQLPLTEEELRATPVLLLKREVTSFIHWLGRMEQGLTMADDIHSRAHRVLSLHQWLNANESKLLHRLNHLNRQ